MCNFYKLEDMKKLLLSLIALVAVSAMSLSARDNISRNKAVLPLPAQQAIEKNFKGDFSFVKIEKELGRISEYEVVLKDGSEISFDNKGNWKGIEMPAGMAVPESFIPEGVKAYVKSTHKSAKIVGIEKKRSGYDVELSDGIDLKFFADGTFNKYD